MTTIRSIRRPPPRHWVGDGFPVRTLFSVHQSGVEATTPFLLLDHAGPAEFQPSAVPRGVDEHPHRGFETVTVVYQGEVEHRDSAGNSGVIGPGDVQWMTAGAGLVHEEKHSAAFTRSGGTLEMAQLWVNLPARHKDAAPGYQTITRDMIPTVELGGGRVRVIAGELNGHAGPARTFTPLDVWSVELPAGETMSLPLRAGHTAMIVVLRGLVQAADTEAEAGSVVMLDREGGSLALGGREDATLLLLAGEPIHEPVVAHGPFVMNRPEEIQDAIADYRAGRMGSLA